MFARVCECVLRKAPQRGSLPTGVEIRILYLKGMTNSHVKILLQNFVYRFESRKIERYCTVIEYNFHVDKTAHWGTTCSM